MRLKGNGWHYAAGDPRQASHFQFVHCPANRHGGIVDFLCQRMGTVETLEALFDGHQEKVLCQGAAPTVSFSMKSRTFRSGSFSSTVCTAPAGIYS